jgi:thiamine transporter
VRVFCSSSNEGGIFLSNWWRDLIEKFTELPGAVWYVLALLVIAGAALVVMVIKRAPKPALIALSAVLLVALVAAVYLTLPVVTPDLESGGVTTASWLYSPTFWAVAVCVLGVFTLIVLLRQTQWTTKMLAAGALCIALSFILDCLTLYKLPQGGGITPAAMLPVMFFAWTFGVVPGIAAGTVHGLLGMIAGAYVIHPLQFLLDYILPFAALGLAGVFKGKKSFPFGILLACSVRFLMHFLSGWVYFGSYAPPDQTAFAYSLGYNASYMVPNTIICLAVYLIPPVRRMLDRIRLQWNPSRAA